MFIAKLEKMKTFCIDKSASHKMPAFFVFIEEFPMTASGKIQKYKLSDMATETLGREAPAKIKNCLI